MTRILGGCVDAAVAADAGKACAAKNRTASVASVRSEEVARVTARSFERTRRVGKLPGRSGSVQHWLESVGAGLPGFTPRFRGSGERPPQTSYDRRTVFIAG